LAWNSRHSCLSLPTAEITDKHHHGWPETPVFTGVHISLPCFKGMEFYTPEILTAIPNEDYIWKNISLPLRYISNATSLYSNMKSLRKSTKILRGSI
jgi:hypothetical protein